MFRQYRKVIAYWVRNFRMRFPVFFVFLILSYQNACYGCENAENRTWSEFFYDGRKFRRQCVNMIDTTWGCIYFLTCKHFGRVMTFRPSISRYVVYCRSAIENSLQATFLYESAFLNKLLKWMIQWHIFCWISVLNETVEWMIQWFKFAYSLSRQLFQISTYLVTAEEACSIW